MIKTVPFDPASNEPDAVIAIRYDSARALKGRGPDDVRFSVFRENTEGLYVSVGGRFKPGTDDEIAISACLEREGRRRFRDACASNRHFKREMCALAIRNGTRSGTLDQCLDDPAFKGRTIERGGVGG